ITVIKTKDYIQNPKPNGYRSLHLILEVPVFLSDRKQTMKVEVQIRTIAMDFWASLDHQLRYKKSLKNAEKISAELKECADTISATDQKMQNIKYQIYGY
ncbi:MAG: GTP pyrophosphokinase family protein, partial [Lachnospiraceae bacterium]|nr:GTP pyrophosphokinase family protein [Lachnospiraceae bacterium]